jgi:hypothetical protein
MFIVLSLFSRLDTIPSKTPNFRSNLAGSVKWQYLRLPVPFYLLPKLPMAAYDAADKLYTLSR